MKQFISLVRTIAPQASISRRNREPHIRIKRPSASQLLALKELTISSDKDKRYSSSYTTHFLKMDEHIIPTVISCPEYKVTGGKILQKQLTPVKLGVTGTFTDLSRLIEVVRKGIHSQTERQLLEALVNHVAYDAPLSGDMLYDYKINRRAIDKDFGEILAGISLLKENGCVTFPDDEATAFFDLISNGVSYNVKSGKGSGQSFKSLNLQGSFTGNEQVCFEMIKAMVSTGSGKERIYKMIEQAKLYEGIPGALLSELRPYETKDDYLAHVLALQTKYELSVGLPNLDDFNSENAYLFTACTFISNVFPEDVVTAVISKLSPPVKIIHIKFSQNMFFDIPENVRYKFHFWGNVRGITNNLPGFKSLY